MQLVEDILQSNGASIHYWTGGKNGAPWVIFTHGASIDHNEWNATLPLVGEHFHVLAWDVRAHGLSRPAGFSIPAAVSDLLALLDRVGAGPSLFVGHSMGGNLHQELVFHHPERVLAMAFLDCTWNFQKLTPLERLSLRMAGPLFKLYPYAALLNQSVAATAASPESQALVRSGMQRLSKDEFVNILLATTACLHEEPGYAINKPLLLMVGEHDRTGNIRAAMPAWAAQEPNARLVVIPNARHAPNLDNPDFFHKTLLDFLLPFA